MVLSEGFSSFRGEAAHTNAGCCFLGHGPSTSEKATIQVYPSNRHMFVQVAKAASKRTQQHTHFWALAYSPEIQSRASLHSVCSHLDLDARSHSGGFSPFSGFLLHHQVVHFGGYTLGRAHSQRVRVVNVSRTSQRLHILGPSTASFKVRSRGDGLVNYGVRY